MARSISVDLSGGIQKFLVFNCLFLGLVSSCAGEINRDKFGYSEAKEESRAGFGRDASTESSEIIISAAASMRKVLEEIKNLYNRQYPQAEIVFNFGSSGSLSIP